MHCQRARRRPAYAVRHTAPVTILASRGEGFSLRDRAQARAIVVAGALFALSIPGPVLTQQRTETVSRLVDYLVRTGKFGKVSGAIVTRDEVVAQDLGNCNFAVNFAKNVNGDTPGVSSSISSSFAWAAPLARMSPVVTVSGPEDDGTFVATAMSTTGDSVVRLVGEDILGPQKKWLRRLAVHADTRANADTVAALLASAIRSCGGQPASREVLARVAADDSTQQAKVNKALGRDLTPEQRNALLEPCYAQVRARLKAPSSAKFDALKPPSLYVADTSALISGTVEAANGLGGVLQQTYSCIFEKLGSQFIPKGTVIY